MKIVCYTDGACKPNPGVGGWGWVAYNHRENGTDVWYSWGGLEHSTNNEMELTALSDFFKSVHPNSKVEVWTDSKYAFGGIVGANVEKGRLKSDLVRIEKIPQGWLKGWTRVIKEKKYDNYWVRKPEPKNPKLWYTIHQTLLRLSRENCHISIGWVKGHNDDPGNEYADRLSNNFPLNEKWSPPKL